MCQLFVYLQLYFLSHRILSNMPTLRRYQSNLLAVTVLKCQLIILLSSIKRALEPQLCLNPTKAFLCICTPIGRRCNMHSSHAVHLWSAGMPDALPQTCKFCHAICLWNCSSENIIPSNPAKLLKYYNTNDNSKFLQLYSRRAFATQTSTSFSALGSMRSTSYWPCAHSRKRRVLRDEHTINTCIAVVRMHYQQLPLRAPSPSH